MNAAIENETAQLPVEPRPRNYARFWWSQSHRWVLRGRYDSPQRATLTNDGNPVTLKGTVVIDVVSGRMIWKDGKWCSRKAPSAIPSLPIERYEEGK